jgi:hypothetical protein
MVMRRDFKASCCDRCGRTTPAKQNNDGDLFLLPDNWAEADKRLADQGSFCQRCIDRYSPEDWIAWLSARDR